jgi:hypothetical protein
LDGEVCAQILLRVFFRVVVLHRFVEQRVRVLDALIAGDAGVDGLASAHDQGSDLSSSIDRTLTDTAVSALGMLAFGAGAGATGCGLA